MVDFLLAPSQSATSQSKHDNSNKMHMAYSIALSTLIIHLNECINRQAAVCRPTFITFMIHAHLITHFSPHTHFHTSFTHEMRIVREIGEGELGRFCAYQLKKNEWT